MRQAFEQWISTPPYERDIARWPLDEARYAWPGQYQDIAVQLAWEGWQQALKGIECSQTEHAPAESHTPCSPAPYTIHAQ